MCSNHRKIITCPPPQIMEKLSSMKPVLLVKRVEIADLQKKLPDTKYSL